MGWPGSNPGAPIARIPVLTGVLGLLPAVKVPMRFRCAIRGSIGRFSSGGSSRRWVTFRSLGSNRVSRVSVDPVGWKLFAIEASVRLPRNVTFDEDRFDQILCANGAMSLTSCEHEDVGHECIYRWRFEVEAGSRIGAAKTANYFLDDAWASCTVLERPEELVDFDVVVGGERWELLTGE